MRLRCFNTTCYRAVLQGRDESIEDSEWYWGKNLGRKWVTHVHNSHHPREPWAGRENTYDHLGKCIQMNRS